MAALLLELREDLVKDEAGLDAARYGFLDMVDAYLE